MSLFKPVFYALVLGMFAQVAIARAVDLGTGDVICESTGNATGAIRSAYFKVSKFDPASRKAVVPVVALFANPDYVYHGYYMELSGKKLHLTGLYAPGPLVDASTLMLMIDYSLKALLPNEKIDPSEANAVFTGELQIDLSTMKGTFSVESEGAGRTELTCKAGVRRQFE